MTDATGSPSTVPSPSQDALGTRLLHVVLFAVVFWITCWAVAVTTVVQLAFRVFAGAPSPELRRFGGGLARYAGQLIAYLSFASDRLPFPLGDWPDAGGGISRDDLSGL